MAQDTAAESDLAADPVELTLDDVAMLEEPDIEAEPVTYSGTDFDAEGLVRRLNRRDILVPTFGHNDPDITAAGFQRRFVWSKPQKDRFIESLLLGYPIPAIFLVQQEDRRYLVLDGQQRLRTLVEFYGSNTKQGFALQNVAERFRGLTYRTLQDHQRRALDNTFFQAIIVKTDGSQEAFDAVYQIFERLNSGGTQLTAHEIRVALYAGPFIDFLTKCNAVTSWRRLYGPESPRLRDQEIVLRFMALYISPGSYRRPLKKYLNDFVGQHRFLKTFPAATVEERFIAATDLLLRGLGRRALRSRSTQVNAALSEAVLVGLARRLDYGDKVTPEAVGHAVDKLHASKELETYISTSTADEESVRRRLAIATQAFASL